MEGNQITEWGTALPSISLTKCNAPLLLPPEKKNTYCYWLYTTQKDDAKIITPRDVSVNIISTLQDILLLISIYSSYVYPVILFVWCLGCHAWVKYYLNRLMPPRNDSGTIKKLQLLDDNAIWIMISLWRRKHFYMVNTNSALSRWRHGAFYEGENDT